MRFSYDAYHAFSAPLEGRVPGMYCDILGLVTCAVGNLIDPIMLITQVRWSMANGEVADMAQVRADWHLLKDNAGFYSKRHWKYALAATQSRISEDEIDRVVRNRLAVNEAAMLRTFPAWDVFPADAQLAIMSMCWAVGAGWPAKFPNLKAAVLRQDWEGAVASCKIREAGNPGVVPRNAKNRFCFHNAAIVKAEGSDPAYLNWPDVAPFTVRHGATDTGPAVRAHDEAEIALAAWHALEICPYTPPGSGQATLEYEAP